MLALCYVEYHGLNKPWESLTNLLKVNESSKRNRDIEYATYCFSKLIERDFSSKEMKLQSVNDNHIETVELIAYERDFEIFLGLILEGTMQQHLFWENIISSRPEQDKFDKYSFKIQKTNSKLESKYKLLSLHTY